MIVSDGGEASCKGAPSQRPGGLAEGLIRHERRKEGGDSPRRHDEREEALTADCTDNADGSCGMLVGIVGRGVFKLARLR